MYLIEFIDEERDVVLRKRYLNIKDLVNAFFEIRTLFDEIQLESPTKLVYADISADSILIARYRDLDLYLSLSLVGLKQHPEFLDAIPSLYAWYKLWVNPNPEKLQAYLKAVCASSKLLPHFAYFKVNEDLYSIADFCEGRVEGKLILLADSPEYIYLETKEDFVKFCKISEFKPISFFISLNTLVAIEDYVEFEKCLELP